jgi:uncharacterized protein involved in exopolysaccharide biosynthesis
MSAESPVAAANRIVVIVPSPTDDGSIDAAKLFDAVWQKKLLISIATAIVGALFATYALLSDKIYQAQVVVTTAEDSSEGLRGLLSGQLGSLASLAGLGGGALTGKRAEYVALLTSNALLREFIEERNLLPVLFPEIWNAEQKRWEPGWLGRAPRLGDGVDRFLGRILSTELTKEGLITVSVVWTDAQVAAEWANALVARVNEHVRERTIADARRGMEFLEREIKQDHAVSVQTGLYRLQEANLNKIMLATVQPDYALRVIDPAVAPLKPVRPRWFLLSALGIVLGGMLGVGLALWQRRREWWHPGPAVPRVTLTGT